MVRPPLHQRILADIQPQSGPVLLFQEGDCSRAKELTIRNVEKLMSFMNQEEKATLAIRNAYVTVVAREADSAAKSYTLYLVKVGRVLVFKNKWSKLVDDFDLRIEDSVHGWGYRSRATAGEFRLAVKITSRKTIDHKVARNVTSSSDPTDDDQPKKKSLKTGMLIKDPAKKRSTIMLHHLPTQHNNKVLTFFFSQYLQVFVDFAFIKQ